MNVSDLLFGCKWLSFCVNSLENINIKNLTSFNNIIDKIFIGLNFLFRNKKAIMPNSEKKLESYDIPVLKSKEVRDINICT